MVLGLLIVGVDYAVGLTLRPLAAAYNPTYSGQSPLDVENTKTAITVTWYAATLNTADTPDSMVREDDLTGSGSLTEQVSGNPVSGRTIKLMQQVQPSPEIEVGSGTTGADGSYSITVNVGVATQNWEWWTEFLGDTTYGPSETSRYTAAVETRAPTLTLTIDPTILELGQPFTWSGSLYDGEADVTYYLAGRPVYLQLGGADVDGPANTNAGGAYSDSHTAPTTPGTYQYQSRFPGDSPSAYSNVVTVTVKEKLDLTDHLKIGWERVFPSAWRAVGFFGFLAGALLFGFEWIRD